MCSAGDTPARRPDPARLPAFASARATEAAREAARLYDNGYFCGETVIKVANDVAGRPFQDSVMRLGSGFCAGIGGAECTCGALAGAIMAIGLFAGRESALDEWEPSYHQSREILDRFVAEFGSTCCRNIVRPFGGMEGEGRPQHCVVVTGTTTGWVIEIAEQCGWLEPSP